MVKQDCCTLFVKEGYIFVRYYSQHVFSIISQLIWLFINTRAYALLFFLNLCLLIGMFLKKKITCPLRCKTIIGYRQQKTKKPLKFSSSRQIFHLRENFAWSLAAKSCRVVARLIRGYRIAVVLRCQNIREPCCLHACSVPPRPGKPKLLILGPETRKRQ